MTPREHSLRLTSLRARAEERVQGPPSAELDGERRDPRALLQEIRIHKAELEIQNEELHRAHTETEVARDRYQELYDLAPVGYVTLDRGGRVRDANLAASLLLGVHRDLLERRALVGFAHPDDEGKLAQHLQRAFESNMRRACELRLRVGDRTRWVRVESIAQPGGDRDEPECLTVLVDITDRRRATDALREREERLQAVLDSTLDGIVHLDERGIIRTMNKAAERMFGYVAHRVEGRHLQMLLAPSRRHVARAPFRSRRPLSPAEERTESVALRSDGTTFPIELGFVESNIAGARGFTVSVRDLTEQQRLEEEVRQSQKLEAVGRLSSGVAHDFKNLLAGVMGACDIVTSRLAEEDPARRPVEMIRKAAARGTDVVYKLLEFSRKRPLEPRPVCLDELVADGEEMLQRMLGEDIRLQTRLEAADAHALADPGHVEQILLNLVINARDAMSRGGDLVVTTEALELGEEDAHRPPQVTPGKWLVLSVRDTGCGMCEETLDRIFEPFFTTKDVDKGTGLGLSTVYGIVQQLGGTVEVDSEVDRGTTFQVWLPRRDLPAGAELPPPTARTRAEDHELVLLVEDNMLVRLSAEHYLQQAGYRALTADCPEEALHLANESPEAIRVLVTDVRLPGMSGLELADELRARIPGLPVLFMSAMPPSMLEREGRIPEGTPVLEKPFAPQELVSRVHDLLEVSPLEA